LPKLNDCPWEELLQFSNDTVDSRQAANEVIDSSLGQMTINERSFYGQDASMLPQTPSGDCASENLGLPTPTTGIDNEHPSNLALDLEEQPSMVWPGDHASENLEWPSPTASICNGNPSNYIVSFDKQSSTVWLGDCEYCPNEAAINLGII